MLTYIYNDEEGRCKMFELIQKSLDKSSENLRTMRKNSEKIQKIASKKFRKFSEKFKKKSKKIQKKEERKRNYAVLLRVNVCIIRTYEDLEQVCVCIIQLCSTFKS